MKVFFSATPSKYEIYKKRYQMIGDEIESLGHDLTIDWILKYDKSFFDLPRVKWKDHYLSIMNAIERSDVAIWDISVSSTTCGQCIQYALTHKIPVVVLQDNVARVNIFLEGAGDVESKLLVVPYTERNLRKKLANTLKYVEEWLTETRFTMIVDGEMRRYLDEAVLKGESRSEYIRRLVKEDSKRGVK